MEYFPDNTLAHYMTKLPHSIELGGQWEVGLVEVMYPHTWYNITPERGWLVVTTARNDGIGTKMTLKSGYYPNGKTLVEAVNGLKKLVAGHEDIQLSFDGITKKVTVSLQNDARLEFSEDLGRMLGFPEKLCTSTAVAEGVVDTDLGFYSLFIYCDLVAANVVGDSLVPLLRILRTRGQDGQTIARTFEKPLYLPLARNRFDTIEIDIRDDAGERVAFERGKVYVVLEFRRRHAMLL